MNVNAMHPTPAASLAPSSAHSSASLIVLALKTGAAAALVAALLAGHVSEPVIVVGVIVVASLIGWHRTQPVAARVRTHHRFTVVSRCGDGFVTIDSTGARHGARGLVLRSPSS
jgi:hypothetical protein